MTVSGFQPGRQQDAFATIAGFYYQIQRTLGRGLSLGENEVLYLECGEDIDLAILSKEDQELNRRLEQVKARKRNLTLRSADALTSVANFCSHREANPSAELRFCFTTTALIGKERNSPLGRLSGIEAWMRVHRGDLAKDHDESKILAGIAKIIGSGSCPPDCSTVGWSTLQTICADGDRTRLADLVGRLEWSTSNPDWADLELELTDAISAKCQQLGLPSDLANERYRQLIAWILSVLSREGVKQLTATDLREQLASPSISAADQSRLELIERALKSHSDRLTRIEGDLALAIGQGESWRLFGSDVESSMRVSAHEPGGKIPPLVRDFIRREALITATVATDAPSTWIAVHGLYGIGKSHFSRLLAERIRGEIIGLNCRDLSPSVAGSIVELLIRRIESSTGQGDRIIVIADDLPRLQQRSPLTTQVLRLWAATRARGGSLITTCRHQLHSSIQEASPSPLHVIECPPFTDAEAAELVNKISASPADFTDSSVAIFNRLCGGHPVLLGWLARLAGDDDGLIGSAIAYFAQGISDELDQDSALALAQTIPNRECRELLYRLCSLGAALTTAEIREIAKVEPRLGETTLCLAELEGTWLRRTTESLLEVSPLVRRLSSELDLDLALQVSKQGATCVLGRSSLSSREVFQAASLFIAGQDYNGGAQVLCVGHVQAPATATGFDSFGLLTLLPVDSGIELDAGIEVVLRACQASTAVALKKDPARFFGRIVELIEGEVRAEIEELTVAGGILLRDPMPGHSYCKLMGARLIEISLASDEEALSKVSIESLPEYSHIIVAAGCARSLDDLVELVGMLRSMSRPRLSAFLKTELAREMLWSFVFTPIFGNPDQDVTEKADRVLMSLCDEIPNEGSEWLRACLNAARIVILAEYLGDLQSARAVAAAAKPTLADDPKAVALVDAFLGQQCMLNDQHAEARVLLRRALALDGALIGLNRVFRTIDAIVADWSTSEDLPSLARVLSQALTNVALDGSETLCRFRAQLALTLWRCADHDNATEQYGLAVDAWRQIPEGARRNRLAAGLVTALNYCRVSSTAARNGAKDEIPELPHVAIFDARSGTEVGAGFDALTAESYIPYLLSEILFNIDRPGAGEWASISFDSALQSGRADVLILVTPTMLTRAVELDQDAAIEYALCLGRAYISSSNEADESKPYKATVSHASLTEALLDSVRESRAQVMALDRLSWSTICTLTLLAASELGSALAPANRLASKLRLIAEELSDREPWSAFADLLDAFSTSDLAAGEFKRFLTFGGDDARFMPVRRAAHGLLALHGRARLGQAVYSHATIAAWIEQNPSVLGVSQNAVFGALSEFWFRTVKERSFLFRSPPSLLATLDALQDDPAKSRLRSSLSAIALNNGLTLSGDAEHFVSPHGAE